MAKDQRSNRDQFRDLVQTFRVSWGPLPSIAPHMNEAPGLGTGMVLSTLSCGERAIGELEAELSEASAEVERWRAFQGPADDLFQDLSDMLVGSDHMHSGNTLTGQPDDTAEGYQEYGDNIRRALQALIDENAALKKGSQTPVETAMRVLVDRASEKAAEAWDADIEGEEGMTEWSELNQRPRDRLMMPLLTNMLEEWVRDGHHLERPEPEQQSVFDPDTVVKLEENQTAGQFHPYTCANRGDGNHRVMLGDLGALVPTVRGWICPFCDYTQGWAHGLPDASEEPAGTLVAIVPDSHEGRKGAGHDIERHLLEAAVEVAAMHGRATANLISSQMDVTYEYAVAIMDVLIADGVVGDADEVGNRRFLGYPSHGTQGGGA